LNFLTFSQNSESIGNEMHNLMKELFPICRSITGNGVRDTLKILQTHIPISVYEIPSETKVFDWKIPKEWNIHDAYVIDPKGKKIIDFKKSNLHVVSYSIPIHKKMSLSELKPHLHTIPEIPDAIPYRTSYYDEDWGFCMKYNDFQKLEDGEYEIMIDSSLENGFLTYGEFFKQGELKDEFLISCYICHPSMCNDNLSGTVLATFLAKILQKIKTKFSYRILFIPETIGAITWLFENEKNLNLIKYGLVATCLGDSGTLTYKKTRDGNHDIDKISEYILEQSNQKYTVLDFFPIGSDERQFCSPGFNLPVGSLVRTGYGQFSEYHTSKDDLNFVKANFLADTFSKYCQIINLVENNEKYINLNPKCEPQLGKRNLWNSLGGQRTAYGEKNASAIFWILNQSDGTKTLLDIAIKSKIDFNVLKTIADNLVKQNLLKLS
jgi:aminopeptidase-like protein